jgi:hypothetical protein
MNLSQNLLNAPIKGQSANMAHFVAFFNKLSIYCEPLKLLFKVNTWVIGDLKKIVQVIVLLIFVKKAVAPPRKKTQTNRKQNKNIKTVFESSVMIAYDMYHKKMHYNVIY